MKKSGAAAIFFVIGMLMLLQCCMSPGSSSSTTPTSSQTYQTTYQTIYQWTIVFQKYANADGSFSLAGESWSADSSLRVTLQFGLSSTSPWAGVKAVTILDSTHNRRYWAIIGNNGIGQAAAGVLSVIVTEGGNSQAVINQAQQAIYCSTTSTYCQLVLTLDESAIRGELKQGQYEIISQASLSGSPISAGNTNRLYPGVRFAGKDSSTVYLQSFQVERYQKDSIATYTPSGGSGSCPYIYSFDGSRFIMDAEPYGGSICKGLKRTEWCVLEHLKQVRGGYELLMTNELDETQYTDELKLLVVDHPVSMFVVPDVSGAIHTFHRPLAPFSAVDRAGSDIRALCSAKDQEPWTGSMRQFDYNGKNEPRDTLTFCFEKPENAASAKLVINAGTTRWGAAMGKRFLAMYGSGLGFWYDQVDKGGVAYQRIMDWYKNEELYMLKLQVATRTGWKTKTTVLGAGPFIAADRAYVIDIRDVPGTTLKVRLAPPAGFWAIDWIAVDYTTDAPIVLHEIAPIQALYCKGNDVRQALDGIDNNYHAAEKGDTVRMMFSAPAWHGGLGRTAIIKANGYYKMHLKATGLPQLALIAGMDSPGFSARYSLEEYRKWEQKRAQ